MPYRFAWLLGAILIPARAEQPTAWQDPTKHEVRLVTVDEGVQLEVLDWGGSGRAVVLLAGAGNTAHVFDDFAPKLAGKWHVYGITRRGYGGSSRPAAGYDEPRLAQDIVRAIDALGIAAPVLAGHSMAGGEMTIIGRKYPRRIAGLVYLDALGDPRDWTASDPAYMELARKLPMPPPAPPAGEEATTFSGYRAYQLRTTGGAWPESELRIGYQTNPDGSKGAWKTPSSIFRALGEGQTKRDYTGIVVPVLALYEFPRRVGDPKLVSTYKPKDAAEREAIDAFNAATIAYVNRWVLNLLSGASDVHIIDLPGAGHYVFLSREAEVLRAMDSFLTGLR